MLFRIDPEGKQAETVSSESFANLPYHERYDIQEWVLQNPELLGEPLLVITSEYAGFDRTSERLDVLAADDFGPEVTATVLWLRSFGLDARCVRLTPYRLGADLVVESSALIPLPEAEEYLVRRQKKDVARTVRESARRPTLEEYVDDLPDELRPLFQAMRSRLAGEADVKETVFRSGVSYRMREDNAWITWLAATKTQARFILPDEEDFPEEMGVKSERGWTTLRLRGPEDLEVAKRLLEARLERVRREGGSSVLTPG